MIDDQHLISVPMVSIQYPANKYENTQTYQVEVVILIYHQILGES